MTTPRTQFVSSRSRVRVAAGEGWGRNQNLVPFQPGAKLGPVANAVIIVLLIALLGLLYLTQLTKTGSFSYEMNNIDNQKTQLAAEQDNLKVENARLQSLSRIKGSEVAAAMTTPVDTNYAN